LRRRPRIVLTAIAAEIRFEPFILRGIDVSVVEQEVFGDDPREARVGSNSVLRQSSDALDRFSRVMVRAGIAMKVVACKTDEAIYHDGDRAESIYQVVRGAVRSSKHFSEGHRRIAAFHLPGQIFGLEYGSIHGSAAEATIDSTLRVVKRSSIEQAAKLDAQVACELWSMTADALRRAEDLIQLLGQKAASKQVVGFLLEMDSTLAGRGEVELPMSRRDVADYLGLTHETVSRVLSKLENQHILAFSRARSRRILLFNRTLLRSMSA
jgi:CRP/FNR family nitrogen fixation transcriptional regulator